MADESLQLSDEQLDNLLSQLTSKRISALREKDPQTLQLMLERKLAIQANRLREARAATQPEIRNPKSWVTPQEVASFIPSAVPNVITEPVASGVANLASSVADALSTVDPMFSPTKGLGEIPVDKTRGIQEPGVKRNLATLLELAGSAGGAAIGTAGGAAPAFPDVLDIPVMATGAEAGLRAADLFNKEVGLRPKSYDSLGGAKESLERIATDITLPLALKGLSKSSTAFLEGIAGVTKSAKDKLGDFLSINKNQLRAITNRSVESSDQLLEDLAIMDGVLKQTTGFGVNILEELPVRLPEPGKTLVKGLEERQGKTPFQSLKNNIVTAKSRTGKALDELLSKAEEVLPANKTIQLNALDFRQTLSKLDKEKVPYFLQGAELNDIAPDVLKKATRDVWKNETDNFAKRALSADDYRQYKGTQAARTSVQNAIDKVQDKIAIGDGDIDALEDQLIKLYDKEEVINSKFLEYETEIFSQPYSLRELRELKTYFEKNARFDRKTVPDNADATRANVYKELSGIIRNHIQKAVTEADPALGEQLKNINRTYSALSNVSPLVDTRIKEFNQLGPGFVPGAYENKPKKMLTKLGMKTGRYAEAEQPEAMLQRGAGQLPRRTEEGAQALLGAASAGAQGLAEITKGIDYLSTPATTSYLRTASRAVNEGKLPEGPIGAEAQFPLAGIDPRLLEQPAPTPEPEPEGITSSSAADMLSRLNPFAPATANAEEMPMPGAEAVPMLQAAMPKPQPIPRDPDIIAATPEHIRTLMTALSPNAAQLMVDALETKDPIKRRLAFSVALQEAPDLFEGSVTGAKSEIRVGNGFVLGDPREIPLIKARLTARFRQGEIRSDKLAKQISALNDPTDQRLFPEPPYASMEQELSSAIKRPSSPQEALSRATPRTINTPAGERRVYSEGATSEQGKSVNDNAKQVAKALKQRGYSSAAIAGILGNLEVETGGSFDYEQRQVKGPAVGLFQFDFMKPYYKAWLQKTGYDDSLDAQVEYVDRVIKGDEPMLGAADKRALQKALEMDDPIAIAEVFSNHFLKPGKPHLERRKKAAEKFAGLLGVSTDRLV